MKGNAVSRNMMLRIPRRRWTCWNQLTFAFKTSAKRCFCDGSSGCQYAAKSGNERTTGIGGFLFTVIVHMPFSPKRKIQFLPDFTLPKKFSTTTRCLTGDLFQPQFMTVERPRRAESFYGRPMMCTCA